MRKVFIFVCLVFILGSAKAQNEINIMSYNLLRYPEALPVGRADTLAKILETYKVDVLGVSELLTNLGSIEILNKALNGKTTKYKAAKFTPATRGDLHQMLYYNSDKLALYEQDTVQSNTRDFNKYTLYPITTDLVKGDTIFIDFYVCHLKAGQDSEDSIKRIENVSYLVRHLDMEVKSKNRVLMGDFNLYTDKEEAYQLLTEGSIPYFKDPIASGGNWHNNYNYRDIFTQSSRSQQLFNEGSGGGIDDRFDFILTSSSMVNASHEVHYKENSYKALGNDGNCFNKNITDCGGDKSLLSSLYYMSDHLPVVSTLELLSAEFVSVSKFQTMETKVWFDANHHLQIELSEPSIVEVYNAEGQRVAFSHEKADRQIIKGIQQHPQGIYFIHFLDLGKVVKVALIK